MVSFLVFPCKNEEVGLDLWSHRRPVFVVRKSFPPSDFSARPLSILECTDIGMSEAEACWKWNNFLESTNSSGKPVLHINMDESSLRLYVPPRIGLVAEACPKRRRQMLREGREPGLSTRRAAVTLIAFACNDVQVQTVLPQVVVLNERVVPKKDVVDLTEKCSPAVVILRRKSAWLKSDVVVNLINVLGEALKPFARTCRFVLMLDAAKIHLSKRVVQACTRHSIHLMYVPASMTSLLQPLDTHTSFPCTNES